jgi:hypothetical protein
MPTFLVATPARIRDRIKGVKQDDLISKRNKLYIQAMKLFPNSPTQIKVRKEIERLNKLINK